MRHLDNTAVTPRFFTPQFPLIPRPFSYFSENQAVGQWTPTNISNVFPNWATRQPYLGIMTHKLAVSKSIYVWYTSGCESKARTTPWLTTLKVNHEENLLPHSSGKWTHFLPHKLFSRRDSAIGFMLWHFKSLSTPTNHSKRRPTGVTYVRHPSFPNSW